MPPSRSNILSWLATVPSDEEQQRRGPPSPGPPATRQLPLPDPLPLLAGPTYASTSESTNHVFQGTSFGIPTRPSPALGRLISRIHDFADGLGVIARSEERYEGQWNNFVRCPLLCMALGHSRVIGVSNCYKKRHNLLSTLNVFLFLLEASASRPRQNSDWMQARKMEHVAVLVAAPSLPLTRSLDLALSGIYCGISVSAKVDELECMRLCLVNGAEGPNTDQLMVAVVQRG
ncbi:hypothetical protein CH63R_09593 [Colletotrichum higginsianum IMI 349063]|uniref:Uncharacterized protein n=1 Tax=Colletotrichum higginsianum (strain IMI 349063) TaxID=759273 RepID=A0A1B7Y7N4_COLHI|nr:hypothetical protein CH63R_09593 [Colletotrichum higginsianum IMI 349063]OBR08072.1 hypothetical protein CH63R_09593 [Colletotrichum higginsianum IMI 349063]